MNDNQDAMRLNFGWYKVSILLTTFYIENIIYLIVSILGFKWCIKAYKSLLIYEILTW